MAKHFCPITLGPQFGRPTRSRQMRDARVAEVDQVRDRRCGPRPVIAAYDVDIGQSGSRPDTTTAGMLRAAAINASVTGIVPRKSSPSTLASMKASSTDESASS